MVCTADMCGVVVYGVVCGECSAYSVPGCTVCSVCVSAVMETPQAVVIIRFTDGVS